MTPEISIVLINKDDRAIADSLESIASARDARDGDVEVVVVDASEHRLDEIAMRFPDTRWLAFSPIPGRVSIPHQRNAGLAAASGRIIVFIDAGCIPDAGWLDALVEPIRLGEDAIAAGAHRSPRGDSLRDEDTARRAGREYLDEAPTLNIAFARSVFDEVGSFDESFDYGSDVDLCWRAVDAGYRIRYVPQAGVVHDWGDARQQLRRTWLYGRARTRLLLKHRRRWRALFGDDLPVLVYPVYILMLPLLARRPAANLLLLVPLYRNRHHSPARTLANHFVRGVAGIAEVGSQLSRLRR